MYHIHVHICLSTDLAPFSWHCTVRKVRESSCELSGVEIQMASATSLFGAMTCYTLEMNKSKKSKSESHPLLLRRLALDWSLWVPVTIVTRQDIPSVLHHATIISRCCDLGSDVSGTFPVDFGGGNSRDYDRLDASDAKRHSLIRGIHVCCKTWRVGIILAVAGVENTDLCITISLPCRWLCQVTVPLTNGPQFLFFDLQGFSI